MSNAGRRDARLLETSGPNPIRVVGLILGGRRASRQRGRFGYFQADKSPYHRMCGRVMPLHGFADDMSNKIQRQHCAGASLVEYAPRVKALTSVDRNALLVFGFSYQASATRNTTGSRCAATPSARQLSTTGVPAGPGSGGTGAPLACSACTFAAGRAPRVAGGVPDARAARCDQRPSSPRWFDPIREVSAPANRGRANGTGRERPGHTSNCVGRVPRCG